MSRPSATPQEVKQVALQAQTLKRWLLSPDGSSARPGDYAVAMSSYKALLLALRMLPHGERYVAELDASPLTRPESPKPLARPSASFSVHEQVLLDGEVLAADGWVVPPGLVRSGKRLIYFGLLDHVDAFKCDGESDKDALLRLLLVAGRTELEAGRELSKHQMRLSRARAARAEGYNELSKKTPPKPG